MSNRISEDLAASIIADYDAGLPVAEIMDSRGICKTSMYKVLRQAGVPRVRPRGGGNNKQGNPANLAKARAERVRDAGHRQATAARMALRHLLPGDHVNQMVLTLRIDHPDTPSAELAAMCKPPMTRAAYSGRLRRLIEKTSREPLVMDQWLRRHPLHMPPKLRRRRTR